MTSSYFKKTISVLIATLFLAKGFSQTIYPQKVESPNAASLSKFGEVPVNLFTGIPDISIPIYNLSYGKINVPIGLRYSSASVKPGQQPGWVGSGWDLQSIGSISRQVRGQIDEWCIPTGTGNTTGPNEAWYYPFTGQLTSGSQLTNGSNWNTAAQLKYDFTDHSGDNPVITNLEVQADEFSFNFMGHSGKFYYEGPINGWQVVSSEKIKVEVTSFLSPTDITTAIKQYTLIPGIANSVIASVNQSRMFGSFTLTVPDGTKYFFGGLNNSLIADAVEFYSPFLTQTPNGNGNSTPQFIANTWLLKKIVDVKNNEVDFSYIRKYPTCNLVLGFYELNASCTQNHASVAAFLFGGLFGVPLIGSSGTFNSDYVDPGKHSGIFQWPMYLSQISCFNEKINFSSSEAVCSKYSNDQIVYPDLSNRTQFFFADNMGVNQNPQYLNWEKLDKITVTNNLINTSGNKFYPDVLKQFQFNYSNSSSLRLTLNSLVESDKLNNGFNQQYSFAYNNGANLDLNTSQGLPIYYDGNFADHWGFFNNTNIANAISSDIFIHKQPNPSFLSAALLNQITYPTGGYTKLAWEPNDYSQVVSTDRQSLVANTGIGGGNRISEIQEFLVDGTLAGDKKYYYKKGYSAGSNPLSLPSSGVLNGIPQYSFSLTNRQGILGATINNYQATAIIGTANYSYTGQGSPVGFDEVYEVNADGSYTKNLFTNYGSDLNNISHFDKIPIGYLGWLVGTDTYFPMTSLEGERGKPIAVYTYSAGNTLLKKINYTYRNDAIRFNSSINIIDLNASFGSIECTDALVLTTARSIYTYAYYPINETVTVFDQQGNNPLSESVNFTYNINNLVKTKTLNNSKGETIVTTYNYPIDYSDATSSNMNLANILTPVIQTSVTNNSILEGLAYTPYFTPNSGIYVPLSLQSQIGSNTIETRQLFYQYDAQGNLLETSKSNDVHDVYIWGYNSQLIVAKIKGSTYSTASALINQTLLNQAGSGNNGYTDNDVRTELNKLRTGLPNAFVTTYTYACGIGLTSETDAQGRTKFYEYDLFNRLQNIRDMNNNIVKKFCYNYAGQPESCSIFFNGALNVAYTTSCPANNVGSSVIYPVPANKYTAYTQPVADQQAVADQAANGQAYANAHGTCTPMVALPVTIATGGTNPSRIVSVSFYQGSTLVAAHTYYNTTGGSIYAPMGTYTLYVTQTNGISRTVTLSGYTPITGTSATFNNVVMPSGCCFQGSLNIN